MVEPKVTLSGGSSSEDEFVDNLRNLAGPDDELSEAFSSEFSRCVRIQAAQIISQLFDDCRVELRSSIDEREPLKIQFQLAAQHATEADYVFFTVDASLDELFEGFFEENEVDGVPHFAPSTLEHLKEIHAKLGCWIDTNISDKSRKKRAKE